MASKQTKKIKPNRYKPAALSGARPAAKSVRFHKPGIFSQMMARLLSGIRSRKWTSAATGLLLLCAMSVSSIWLHDAVVQSPFFTIHTVDVIGLNRVARSDLLACAGLDHDRNLFEILPEKIEKKLAALPWIAKVKLERHLFSKLSIRVEEETPLAIVAIENLADLVINTQGIPFKEYEPEKDGLETLPVITGMDLTLSDNIYRFEGALFNSIMDLLKVKSLGQIRTIHGDPDTGILIQAPDIYNRRPTPESILPETVEENVTVTATAATESKEASTLAAKTPDTPQILIPIKLGFDRFEEKLAKAAGISKYMAAIFPEKTILAMDLFDMDQIFIKTEDTLHHSSEKGV